VEVVLVPLRAKEIADFTDGAPEGVDGPDGAGSQKGFQLCESHRDRIEVGAIGRKEKEARAHGANGLLGGGAFAGRQIVQDYDVARPKSRSQLSPDASFKNAPVHRRVKASHRRPAMKVCVFQCPNGTFESSLCPLRAAAAQARHLGGRSGLVQKDQPVRLKPYDRLARQGLFLARLVYVGPIMLAGPQSFMEWPAPPSDAVRSPVVQEEEWVWILRSLASTSARTSAASSDWYVRCDRYAA
jgi:hypothetical protein